MNSIENISSFFNLIRFYSGAIWAENNSLSITIPKKNQSPIIPEFIVKNKAQLISVLSENEIFSEDSFRKTIILKEDANVWYPLSSLQAGLWFIEKFKEGTHAFHIPELYELKPGTNIEGVKHALKQVVLRHQILRITIKEKDGQAFQIVHNEPLVIEQVELNDNQDVESLIKNDISQPFNLTKNYPIRIKLYNVNSLKEVTKSKTFLLINLHHLAFDGWSINIIQKELQAYYKAYVSEDRGFVLPDLEIQYKDYARWQNSFLSGNEIQNQLSYWKKKLNDFQTLEFPTDFPRKDEVDYKGASCEFVLGEELSNKIRLTARRFEVSVNSVLLSCFNVLLSKYTGQEDIVTGYPIANRQNRQLKDLVGFFVNTQVNRIELNKAESFHSLTTRIHNNQIEAQQHQDLPFEMLVSELVVNRDVSKHPIFQVLFAVQSFGKLIDGGDDGSSVLAPYSFEGMYEVERLDLSIYVDDSETSFKGIVNYATSLFKQETILGLIQLYKYLIEQLIEQPNDVYSKVSLLKQEDFNRIVYDWNATDVEVDFAKTVVDLFREQTERNSQGIAVVFENRSITYRDLNKITDDLAAYLLENNSICGNDIIGLMLDRSENVIIAMLAVLKTGASFTFIDPVFPVTRKKYIFDDASIKVLITQSDYIFDLDFYSGNLFALDLQLSDINVSSNTLSKVSLKPGNLAYVIYTSGTTGTPKGVMIEHKNLVNLVFAQMKMFDINTKSKVLQYAPLNFDASVWEIFSTISFGGQLLVVPSDVRQDTKLLSEYIQKHNVTLATLPPAVLSVFPSIQLPSLKTLIVAGESCAIDVMERWSESRDFFNAYGPTEVTVCASVHQFKHEDVSANIGKPLDNVKVYVLNADNSLTSIGMIGELFIGGAGVARGYLNQPDLTADRFVENPFASELDKSIGNTRLYKTGDLAKWLLDGNLEFVGRNDEQVKIRGYRIELGEIEQVLLTIPEITQVSVLARGKKSGGIDSKYLVAYYVSGTNNIVVDKMTIQNVLRTNLPEYMIPSAFVQIDSLPLTVNGKIDKRALPDPEFNVAKEDFVEPISISEKNACEIWQELLGVERVGVTDDFFGIGGNSILAIQLSHLMSKKLGFTVKVADVFKFKNIQQIIAACSSNTQIIIPKTDTNSSVLSFSQERLWFIEQYEEGASAYHVPEMYELSTDINAEGIKYALQQIVARHEILRSTLEQKDEHAIQIVNDVPLSFEEELVLESNDFEAHIADEINRPFNLGNEYPIRVIFYTLRSESVNISDRLLLLINFHHIAYDGWSINIFKRELYAYYTAFINNELNFQLPPLAIQYKDFASWHKSYLTDDILHEQLNYWTNHLTGYQNLKFPTDYTRPAKVDFAGAHEDFELPHLLADKLKLMAQKHNVTLNSVMLCGFYILLSKYTGQDDIVVGMPSANRHYKGTEELIGLFVNTLANRAILNRTQSFEELIIATHQNLTDAQFNQDFPFERLLDELKVERDLSMHPIFQVMFEVQSFTADSNTLCYQEKYLKSFLLDDANETSKFDFTIDIFDSPDSLKGQISYATSLFKKETIERQIKHYVHLLGALVDEPNKAYSNITLLNKEEYNKIVFDWNSTDKFYTLNKTVADLFEEQVLRSPNESALIFEGEKLSYLELNEKSNQLANHVRSKYEQLTGSTLNSDTLIALCLDRSLETVISIIAVLKSGAAYVPIDPTIPQDRIDFILNDSGSNLVLTQRQLVESGSIALPNDMSIFVDLSEELYNKAEKENLLRDSNSGNLAYAMYTSGTTGKPKGVLINNSSLVNLITYHNQRYSRLNKSLEIALLSNYIFDFSVQQIFNTLLYGHTLHIISRDLIFSPADFNRYLIENGIEVFEITPTLFSHLVLPFDNYNESSLKLILIGGESLGALVVAEFLRKALPSELSVINTYGPTEFTSDGTCFEIPNDPAFFEEIKSIPIGKPLDNARAYVLDSNMQPVPTGVFGELYLGGAGLARKYLNRPELTLERFIENRFASESDKEKGYTRLYKTGDLVRWLPCGNIEFLGRNDDQVKINGQRIELGEIENAMMQVAGIDKACVIAKKRKSGVTSNKYLVGYYVENKANPASDSKTIHQDLLSILPDYMVPSILIKVNEFPLTVNGKLDKKALPEPDLITDIDDFVAPVNGNEMKACEIWQDVLGVERVGVTDDFFRIGGNSILAIKVAYHMNKQLGIELKVFDVFKHKNIGGLLAKNETESVTEDKIVVSF